MSIHDIHASGRKKSFFHLVILLIPVVLLLVLTQTAFAENTYMISTTDGKAASVTNDGMHMSVSQSATAEQTYTVAVPYETVYCKDPTLPEGKQIVVTPGVDGQARCVADVYYENGAEVSRVVKSEFVTQAPVNRVVAVGTGPAEDTEETLLVVSDGRIVTPDGEVLSYTDAVQVRATAYTHTDPGCDMYTATGTTVKIGTVAVDPRLIPYGTRMFIVTKDGQYIYGISTAEDCGGAIKGNRIDLYFPSNRECMEFGVRDCIVYILGDAALDTPYSQFW